MLQLLEEIKLLIQYAVPEDEMEAAVTLVEKYRNERVILNLFHEYYSTLPEAREEAIRQIAKLASRQGVFLFVVSSTSNDYIYIVSADEVVLLADYGKDISAEVLSYFDFTSQEEFIKQCIPASELEEYKALEGSDKDVCPACGVLEGEEHLLGCSVEVCPWCDGQLKTCNCRFEQLDIDDFSDEEQLENFEDLLSAKGRIPFLKSQSPVYPGTSDGLDEEK